MDNIKSGRKLSSCFNTLSPTKALFYKHFSEKFFGFNILEHFDHSDVHNNKGIVFWVANIVIWLDCFDYSGHLVSCAKQYEIKEQALEKYLQENGNNVSRNTLMELNKMYEFGVGIVINRKLQSTKKKQRPRLSGIVTNAENQTLPKSTVSKLY